VGVVGWGYACLLDQIDRSVCRSIQHSQWPAAHLKISPAEAPPTEVKFPGAEVWILLVLGSGRADDGLYQFLVALSNHLPVGRLRRRWWWGCLAVGLRWRRRCRLPAPHAAVVTTGSRRTYVSRLHNSTRTYRRIAAQPTRQATSQPTGMRLGASSSSSRRPAPSAAARPRPTKRRSDVQLDLPGGLQPGPADVSQHRRRRLTTTIRRLTSARPLCVNRERG
jgi:hypothetical protein